MKTIKQLSIVLTIALFSVLFISSAMSPNELDPKYIEKFGYGSICATDKKYPVIDKFDESLFDFKNGKFYISKNTALHMRAILPEGKKYIDLLKEFTSKMPEYSEDNALEKIVWRIFASHDVKGNKIYENFPPSPSDMLKEVTYMTSEKELAFLTLDMSLRTPEVREWTTSGIEYNSTKDYSMLIGNWLQNAKPGWQLYIVHTVGYLATHTGNDKYYVEDPIMTATVEIK